MSTAYTLKAPTYNRKLTEVGRGTPMGELLLALAQNGGARVDKVGDSTKALSL